MNAYELKKAILFNGFLESSVFETSVTQAIVKELEKQNIQTKPIILRDMQISPCDGCFFCWMKTPGLCHRTHDPINTINYDIIHSDIYIIFTPITFGGYSSEIKKVQDRMISLVSPFFETFHGETHHKKRYPHYPLVWGIGVLSNPEPLQEDIFKRLVHRNALNLHWNKGPVYIILYEHESSSVINAKIRDSIRVMEELYDAK